MKMNNAIKSLLLSSTVALISGAFATPVLAVSETELNNHTGIAQVLTSTGSAIDVSAVMGFPAQGNNQDVDFYQFTAKTGDLLSVDIDNGYKTNAPLNTILAIYGPAPAYALLRMNIEAPIDSGSISTQDARIDDFLVPADGVYTVGVSRFPTFFYDGGMAVNLPFFPDNGVMTDYNLIINGVSSVGGKKINIEVKPGSKGMAPINPRAKGKIPVAIYGASNFSAVNVDTSTLTFGATGDEQSLSKCNKSAHDINGDGHYDLLCHFENSQAGFSSNDIEAILKGKTRSGEAFEGRAVLKTVPTK